MNAKAQDNNYWNLMPGSQASLMGGVVVGGVRDNSAIYYNPGALGFVDSNTISVSASAYQYEHEKILNGGGANVNFVSGLIQPIPLVFVSAIINIKKKPKNSFGGMLFTKNLTSNSFSYRYDGIKDTSILAGDGYTSKNPGVEYIGEYNLKTSLTELWAGFCYSYQINSHISIGVSPFFAYRIQTLSSSFIARTFPDSTSNLYKANITTLEYDDIENINFSNFRALCKIGIALDYGDLKIGAAFTTPSINLGGSAIIDRDISYGGVLDTTTNSNSPSIPYSYVLNDRQQHLKTTYKSPLSASVGIQYKFKSKTTISFTGEYFGAVAAYDLATPNSQAFLRPMWMNSNSINNNNLQTFSLYQINSDVYLRILEASQSVANFGFAIQQEVSKKIDLVASIRTDFTSFKKASNDFWEYQYVDTLHAPGLNLNFSNINLYHLTFGVIIRNKKSDVYLGVNYTFGTNTSFQPINNIANPGDNTNNLGAVAPNNANFFYPYGTTGNYTPLATYKYSSYSLVLGYTHHFY
jgi:hypothetical protein